MLTWKDSGKHNADLITDEFAGNYTPLDETLGIVTPSALHYVVMRGGLPDIDPARHRLMIHGMVERPAILTMDEIKRLPSTSRINFLECAGHGFAEWRKPVAKGVRGTHGWTSCSEWTGVPLSLLLREAGVRQGAVWIIAEGADATGNERSIPLGKAMDDVLVAYGQNGAALRLIIPGWAGNMNIKWLRRLKVVDRPYITRMDGIGQPNVMADGTARHLVFVLEAKSVITFPSGGQQLSGPGYYEIKGLAGSGRGLVRRVEVSMDGGKSWHNANLQEPVLPRAHTRFRLNWRWDGREAILQSRCIDETAYVQPSLAQLIKVRGLNSLYFNNAIQSWRVATDGSVHNVHV